MLVLCHLSCLTHSCLSRVLLVQVTQVYDSSVSDCCIQGLGGEGSNGNYHVSVFATNGYSVGQLSPPQLVRLESRKVSEECVSVYRKSRRTAIDCIGASDLTNCDRFYYRFPQAPKPLSSSRLVEYVSDALQTSNKSNRTP